MWGWGVLHLIHYLISVSSNLWGSRHPFGFIVLLTFDCFAEAEVTMVTKARTVARQWKNISQVLQKPDQAKVFLSYNYIFSIDFCIWKWVYSIGDSLPTFKNCYTVAKVWFEKWPTLVKWYLQGVQVLSFPPNPISICHCTDRGDIKAELRPSFVKDFSHKYRENNIFVKISLKFPCLFAVKIYYHPSLWATTADTLSHARFIIKLNLYSLCISCTTE